MVVPLDFFSPSRGLKQGDPLSPFLFILGAEVLSRLLFKEKAARNLKGLKISRTTPAIHHLLFVDDLLIFGKATHKEATYIHTCLKKYYLWSGHSINNDKFSKNINHVTVDLIMAILPFSSFPSRSIYLGLPILFGNSKKTTFLNVIDKVKSKVEGWRAKTLSQASRLVLIKSVVAAIPSYAISSFFIPNSICN